MDSNPDPVILPGDPVSLISRLELGQPRARPRASPRASQGPGQGPARARPRASQGPGQGPAKGQAKGQPGPVQGASMHHGPCPAMIGHPGRDTDLILRPSESTIDFLSVFIGFRNLNSVKMKV